MADAARNEDRLIDGERRPDEADAALRPKRLDDFIGQRQAKDNLRIFIGAARRLSRTSLAQDFAQPPGRSLRGRASLPLSSPISSRATSSSSTKFIVCRRRLKRCSIRRWRIFVSTS